jgi:hypothetical protein
MFLTSGWRLHLLSGALTGILRVCNPLKLRSSTTPLSGCNKEPPTSRVMSCLIRLMNFLIKKVGLGLSEIPIPSVKLY